MKYIEAFTAWLRHLLTYEMYACFVLTGLIYHFSLNLFLYKDVSDKQFFDATSLIESEAKILILLTMNYQRCYLSQSL